MPALAVQRAVNAPSLPEPDKKQRISPKLRKVIDLLVTGDCSTQKAASDKVGLHPDHVCRELKKPHIRAFLTQRARETIDNAQLPAVATMVRLLTAESEHVQKDMAIHIARIAGIAPPETGTNISIINNISPGYVIDYSDPRDVTPHALPSPER